MSSQTPSHSDLKASLDGNPTEETFKGYHERIFEFLYALDDDEVVTTDEIIRDAIDKGPKASTRTNTKERRIAEVQVYDPTLSEKIIDKCPPGEVLLRKAKDRTGLSITSQTLNDTQQECMTIAENAKDRYYEYLLDKYENEATNQLGITLDGQLDANSVEALLEEFAFTVAGDLPGRIKSMSNSITACGGTANELIGVYVLSDIGLQVDRDFARVGSKSNEDIVIFSTSGNDMDVEVKSSKARERTPRAIAEMDDPTVIFTFFDDPSEVRSQIISGTSLGSAWPENSVAAYVPPQTIEAVKKLDQKRADGRSIYSETHPDGGKLYLRANNRFAEDAKAYHTTGQLPDLPAGHHSASL